MASYNKTILIGRVNGMSELKKNTKGIEYLTLGILNSDVKGGKEVTLQHKVTCFGKQAILVEKEITKGDLMCIEGRLSIEPNEDEGQGVTIVAERITFLSHKRKQEERAE